MTILCFIFLSFAVFAETLCVMAKETYAIINGRNFTLEEVQVIMLVVLALTEEQTVKFTGFVKWEVKRLRKCCNQKLGADNCLQLAYLAQQYEFTRSGLFRGKPVFQAHLMKKLLSIAPFLVLDPVCFLPG